MNKLYEMSISFARLLDSRMNQLTEKIIYPSVSTEIINTTHLIVRTTSATMEHSISQMRLYS